MIYFEDSIDEILYSKRFIEAWNNLYQVCPWATVFQSKDFVITWYESFPQYSRIIVTDWDGVMMTGLITLTKKNDKLMAAGLDMAEYQGWLSTPDVNYTFLQKSIEAIQKSFPNHTLYLKYLTDKVPSSFLTTHPDFKRKTFFRSYVHPLMETNVEFLHTELKKKNKKEKINRLKRLGNLEFLEVKEIEQFHSLIDEMSLQSDFRKGAYYNKTHFHDEPERKTFLLKLFDLGLLHVSVLKVDGKLIASNAGILGEDRVHLQGINSHSPFFSKYSPGILHFLMLGIELKKSGFRYFDLTPGGADGYKSSLATESRVAYEMWFSNKSYVFKKRIGEKIKNWFKPVLNGKTFWDVDLSNLNMAIMRLKLKFRFLKKRLITPNNNDFYYFLKGKTQFFPLKDLESKDQKFKKIPLLNENHISDLFLFDENVSLISRMDFFADCITRIEYGHSMFTLVEEKKLKGVFWFIPLVTKAELKIANMSLELPSLACSFIENMDSASFDEILGTLHQQIKNKYPVRSSINIEKE